MTIWQGSVPRWQYAEATNTQLTGTNAGSAIGITVMERDAVVFSFVNNSDKEIEILMVNPDDATKTPRLFNRVSPGFGFSSSTLNSGGIFTIPAQTKIFVHAQGAATSGGSFKMFIWG